MQKLKVIQVNSMLNGGGTDNQTLELTAGLRDLGHHVTLAFTAGNGWESRAHTLRVPLEIWPSVGPFKLKMIGQLARFIRKNQVDIVHAHQGRDYWPTILAARLSGSRAHAVISRHLMTPPRKFSRLMLLSMCHVVAVSAAVKNVLKEHLMGPQTKLHQIYGGIDLERFETTRSPAAWEFRRKHGWETEHIVFGVVGTLHLPRGKGQFEFLAAAAQIKKLVPNARFTLIGRGGMETHLQKRIEELGLGEVASLIPFTEQIPIAMSALDVLALPAVTGEALGLVLWEAMASQKPIIASRLHGIPEAFVADEHGFLVEPGNVDELTQAMHRMLLDPGLRNKFGVAGREHVLQNFSRQKHAERMVALYRTIVTS
ncbi:MAG: hypothetical protein JWM16_3376 [Verrucomicrobiales bacterium]|nr:hypothetical protein [Verrucomicrobiales bacterium]